MLPTLATIAILLLSIVGDATAKVDKIAIDAPLLTTIINSNRTIIVDKSGKEDFTSLQEAINSVPDGNKDWIIIHLRAGTYREKIVIPKSKPKIFLRGNGKGKTHIAWNESSTDNTKSSTFAVFADNFTAFGVSFKNDAPIGENNTAYNQSVAALVAGDKVAFYHCAFHSPHNTLFDNKGRHYYESCYIQGSIDFIFGRGQSIFQDCEIFVTGDHRKEILGSITAQNRRGPTDSSGFVFLEGKVYGTSSGVYLGRAKSAHSRVIFSRTYISKTIVPEGWTKWSYDGDTDTTVHGEHRCHGPGANSRRRVSWAKQLNDEDVHHLAHINFINGASWVPAFHK